MAATRGKLQARPKTLKKQRNAKSTNHIEKNSKKNVFSTLKNESSQIFAWELPTEFAGSTQNVKKNCRNIKSTNQNKKFPKKSMFCTLKV
jgi:hypothetical protein